MKATTIKLDGELLLAIERAKASGQSVTSYVKAVLRDDLERKTLRESAEQYRSFEQANPDERAWLDAWADADLVKSPKAPRRGSGGKP